MASYRGENGKSVEELRALYDELVVIFFSFLLEYCVLI